MTLATVWAFLTGNPLILIIVLVILFLVSVFGNIGIDWTNKKFTFGSQRTPKARSCADCIRLLMAKRTGFEAIYSLKHTNILRQQMVYAEHKIIEIETLIKNETHASFKDELRRSFKENGFFEMNKSDYTRYIEERTETLTSLLNSTDTKINSIIKDIYDNAKLVKARIDLELKRLEEEFVKDIDSLIKEA